MNVLTLGGGKYIVDAKKMVRTIIIVLFALIMAAMFLQKEKPVTSMVTVDVVATTETAKIEEIKIITTQPITVEVVAVAKRATIMSEQKFVNQVTAKFSKLTNEMASGIYKEAIKNNLPPYASLGIAWQESKFDSNAIGPTTRYGTARGLYQVIESSAKVYVKIQSPAKLYQPSVAIHAGNKILGMYRDWLSGKTDNKTPKVFKNFSVEGSKVLYKGKVIRDQKGEAVPLLLMTTLSYNAGPGIISAALDQDGILVIDPKLKNCNIPIQSLDYALSINQNVFNFEYTFDYDLKDIDRAKIL